MPSVASSLGSTQRYIPVVPSTQVGRYAGLHMHFPTLVAFNLAVTDERSNITDSSPIWADGQVMTVLAEAALGVHRIWDATAQHARKVWLGPGRTVVLAGDSNTVRSTSGIPSNSIGANGDIALDWTENRYYTRNGGTWSDTGAIIPSVLALDFREEGVSLAPQTGSTSSVNGPILGPGGVRMAASTGVFVAAGSYASLIYRSTDGVTWTSVANPGGWSDTIADIAWDQERFCIIGTNGHTMTSVDGVTWTVHGAVMPSLPSGTIWSRITSAAEGTFFAVSTNGDGDAIEGAVSVNGGLVWSAATLPFNGEWIDVEGAFLNGEEPTLVAIAANNDQIAVSIDNGANWSTTTVNGATSDWHRVHWNGALFGIVSAQGNSFAYSVDGSSWSENYPLPDVGTWFLGSIPKEPLDDGTFYAFRNPNGQDASGEIYRFDFTNSIWVVVGQMTDISEQWHDIVSSSSVGRICLLNLDGDTHVLPILSTTPVAKLDFVGDELQVKQEPGSDTVTVSTAVKWMEVTISTHVPGEGTAGLNTSPSNLAYEAVVYKAPRAIGFGFSANQQAYTLSVPNLGSLVIEETGTSYSGPTRFEPYLGTNNEDILYQLSFVLSISGSAGTPTEAQYLRLLILQSPSDPASNALWKHDLTVPFAVGSPFTTQNQTVTVNYVHKSTSPVYFVLQNLSEDDLSIDGTLSIIETGRNLAIAEA